MWVLTQFLNGLNIGIIYFLMAAGLNIVLGVLRVINLAQASFFMLGGYFAFTVASVTHGIIGGVWLSYIIGATLVALIGLGVALLVYRFHGRSLVYQLLVTYGVFIFFQGIILVVYGPLAKIVPTPPGFQGSTEVAGDPIPLFYFPTIAIGAGAAFFIWVLFYKTTFGSKIRALASNREMASALGINVFRHYLIIFFIGAFLASLGGAIRGSQTVVCLTMAPEALIVSFVIIIIGGIGNVWGSLIGALIVGQVSTFGLYLYPDVARIFMFLVMIAVLLVKPWGLLGKKIEL